MNTVITGLFAMIFKVLRKTHVAWKDVWVGAALMSLLFTIGEFAIGIFGQKQYRLELWCGWFVGDCAGVDLLFSSNFAIRRRIYSSVCQSNRWTYLAE
jgi:hypothetical protein